MKRLLLFVVLLLIIAGAVGVPFLLRQDKYRHQVASHLSQRLGHKVVIGRLEPGWFPPALTLKDVSLLNPEGDAPLLHVDKVLATINWPALFRGSIAPKSLTFQGWVANVRRNKDASWAWDEWLIPTARMTQSSNGPIQTITLEKGECRAVDPYGPMADDFVFQVLQGGWERDRQYVSLNGVFTSLPTAVNFLFQGSGSFVSNPQWSAVLELTEDNHQWKLECKAAGNQLAVAGHSDQWRFDIAYALARFYTRLPVGVVAPSPSAVMQNWESRFDWQGSTLSFTQNANLAGGRAEANGSILFRPTLSVAQADIAVQDVKIQPIEMAMFGSGPLEGTAIGLAHFELALSSSPWDTLKGQGAMELKDGRYYLPDVSTRGLVKAHTMKYLLKKYPGFLGGGLALRRASAHWQIRRGMISVDDGFSDLGDIRVGLVGDYDLPRKGLDAYVRVQVREKNPNLLKELPPSYLYNGESGMQTPDDGRPPAVWRIQPMHGRVQGSPAEWKLRAARHSKIPPAVVNKLSRALRQK